MILKTHWEDEAPIESCEESDKNIERLEGAAIITAIALRKTSEMDCALNAVGRNIFKTSGCLAQK